MKIKIIESFQEREFDLDEGDVVKIGSSAENDIIINGPSVAERHLTLSVINNEIYATDLGSGKPCFIDDEPLVPGEEKALNSFFPIVIGDIKINVEDEVLSPSFDDLIIPEDIVSQGNSIAKEIENDDENKEIVSSSGKGRLSDDELIYQIKKQYKKNNDDSSKNSVIGSHLEYKPNTDTPKMRQATGSTRIHLNSKKKKISKSSENYNELLEKRKKKVKEKTELGPLLIFFLGIVLAGLTYYIQFYKPKMDVIANDVKKAQAPLKNLEISVLFDKKIENHKDLLLAYLSGNRCNQPISNKMCEDLKRKFNTNEKRALIHDGTIVIGISNKELKALERKIINEYGVSENVLQKIVENDYSEFFTFKEFKDNGLRPTLFGNVAKGDTYNKINILYMFYLEFLQGKIQEFRTSNVTKILVFSFDEDPKNFFVDGFIELSEIKSMNNPLVLVDKVKDIVVFDKYLLNNNIEGFYNARISSHINNFDSSLAQKVYFKNIVIEMLSDKTMSHCEDEGIKICSLLNKKLDEEFLVQVNDAFIFIQFSPKWSSLLPKEKEYKLSRIEKDMSVSLLKSKFGNVDTVKYIKNDYVLNEIDSSIKTKNLLAYLFVETELFKLIRSEFSGKQVVLSFTQDDLDHFLILDSSKLSKLNKEIFDSQKTLFARTKVPFYLINIKPFINDKIKL